MCAIQIRPHAADNAHLTQVNKYPGQRTFSAIGTGGENFKANMLAAVESVTGPVHVEVSTDRWATKLHITVNEQNWLGSHVLWWSATQVAHRKHRLPNSLLCAASISAA